MLSGGMQAACAERVNKKKRMRCVLEMAKPLIFETALYIHRRLGTHACIRRVRTRLNDCFASCQRISHVSVGERKILLCASMYVMLNLVYFDA